MVFWHQLGTKLKGRADRASSACPVSPGLAKHCASGAMWPLWSCARKNQHSVGTSRRIASPSDCLLLPAHNYPRTGGKPQHKDRTFVHEAMSLEVSTRQWFGKFAHSPTTTGCAQVWHGGHRALNNGSPFECKGRGSLGRVERILPFRRPCDAPLERVMAAPRQKHSATS